VPKPFEEMMAEGRLGRKAGKGFYDYGEGRRTPLTPAMAGSFDPLRILAPMVNEAARLVEEGAASPEEIDLAMRLGTAFPLGPLAQGDVWGLDQIIAALRASGRFEVIRLLEDKVQKGETGKSAGRGFYGYEVKELEAFETIRLEMSGDGRIATVVLNRPDRLNTLTPQMVEELDRALGKLRGSGEARCLVLRGQGPRAFCAGADITAFMGADRAHKVWAFTRRPQEVFSALEAFPLPTIAAIDGYALGGGCELALACDFRIASKRSTLGQTELGLGLIPGAGGTQRLVRIIGLGRAKEAVFLAKRYPAAEAQGLGLIHAAVEDDRFEASVAELAGRLAKGPPIALRLAKQLLNAAVSPGAEAGLAMEALAFAMVTSTEDVMEGFQAFLDKREPKFKGS
jgi:enoyl-CoA hydratase/3-hydroxyacyl-CoA dehydrogenase